MKYDRKMLYEELEKSKEIIKSNPIPVWEELPNLELYMDQVIILLNRYLKLFSISCEDNKFITPPMINNYVKLKIMPPPVKKKYGRIHMAYLIVICSMKQTLSMATIQKIIPLSLSEEEVKQTYGLFVKNHNSIIGTTVARIDDILDTNVESDNTENINNIVIQSAITSIITKLISERIADKKSDEE